MEFLNISEDVNWMTKVRGRECQSLLGLFEGLDACRGATHSLQWSFDLCQGLSVQDGPHAVSAFAVTASLAYVEALRRMVRAIADHVGEYGRNATRWPLPEIGDG
ncbi:uncharacterized protein BBA_08388 [Beauveria bassiana ARSEF 2860]|uniref:Uncharacterized protein n=1 Tax=Beauveria bassiana (strain ARSEF 2860) TaxID=655819 RepID=J5J8J5_BEAB2|nr:uncharacterized protein BBA_08388 [Beauveria bassiana ARSEF 2860]EJP62673.1 hypothetical protein BBA_08388 [Beauveria bassiana ARSEF 2860]